MKNYGIKVFHEKLKLKKLVNLAKSNKYSAPKLAKIFHCDKKVILGTLNRFGIHLPNLGKFRKKYSCNDRFFVKLNPVSAYWLGFIAADGSLSLKDKGTLISLMKADAGHLQKFLDAIKSNSKIGYVQSNKSAHINIYSNDLFTSLIKLGITPNKSLRIKEVHIPSNLISHFVRGLFDGDGSISGKKVTHIQFQIAGYKPLLRQIQNVLIKRCSVNKVKIYPLLYNREGKAFRLQYTGSQIFRILNFLYKNSTSQTRLERKYKKYLMFKKKFGK